MQALQPAICSLFVSVSTRFSHGSLTVDFSFSMRPLHPLAETLINCLMNWQREALALSNGARAFLQEPSGVGRFRSLYDKQCRVYSSMQATIFQAKL